jgi:hypothetical protein
MRTVTLLLPLRLGDFVERKNVEITNSNRVRYAMMQRDGWISITPITSTTAWVELTPKGRAEIERKGGA